MRISGITYVPRKKHRVRGVFVLFFVLILLAVITLLSVSSYVGWNLTHPEKLSIPAFSSNIVPEYKDVGFYDINKSIVLKGWLFESKGSDKTVILSHGYGKNRLEFEEQTLNMIKSFLEKGYNVFSFDFRNSGISGGNLTSIGLYEKDDLLGAIKYIKSQGHKHIVLMGFSMGASTSLLAAASSSDVEAVIADSPFSDLTEYLNSQLSVWSHLPKVPFNKLILYSTKILTGIDTEKVSPMSSIKNIAPRPVLLIHSKDDASISVKNSEELYSIYSGAAGDKAEFWKTEGVGHVGTYRKYPEEYMNRVFEFLDKVYPKKK